MEAVAALPRDRYDITVLYVPEVWKDHLRAHDIEAAWIEPSRILRLTERFLWRLIFLPISLWRFLSPLFHPVARALVAGGCDLWLFPGQDHWSYLAPVPALVSILDLMHRYERRFPEVSARGHYHERERHYRCICRWTRGVLVDSELGRRHVHESYGISLDTTFALPVVAPAYLTALPDPHFDDKYSLPRKFLFYPAQFWLHKNHLALFEAIARVRKDCPDVRLVLTGAKLNGYDRAMERAKELGIQDAVQHCGYVPNRDMGEFYRRARALVMPTFFGPTNTPQMEAFVMGCPVATSDIYGIPEQVGDAALLFDPSSADDIAACIKRLWLDDALCSTLSSRGRTRAAGWTQEGFSATLAQHLERLLEQQERS